MLTVEQAHGAAFFARLFSSLYINPPGLEFLQELAQQNLASQWPFAHDQHSVDVLMYLHAELEQEASLSALQGTLQEEHLNLFIGLGMPQVPLWGSVYLDKENLLLGPSCLALESFLAQADLVCTLHAREPLDHLGLVLSALAVFLERFCNDTVTNEGTAQVLRDFLGMHINTWVYRCLELQEELARSSFYQALGKLTKNLFVHLSEIFQAERIEKNLYY